jgi:hypothetical protein
MLLIARGWYDTSPEHVVPSKQQSRLNADYRDRTLCMDTEAIGDAMATVQERQQRLMGITQ